MKTIREQLSNEVEAEDEQEVTISLGIAEPEIAPKELTIHQKRNIRRQDYLNKVSERNDAPFFATVAAFVLIPPICILGYAVATGYVDLFPWICSLTSFAPMTLVCTAAYSLNLTFLSSSDKIAP